MNTKNLVWKTLWNQRKHNRWIFVELFLVAMVLTFTMLINSNMVIQTHIVPGRGYDHDQLYYVYRHQIYDAVVWNNMTDQQRHESMLQQSMMASMAILEEVRKMDEVEQCCVADLGAGSPQGGGGARRPVRSAYSFLLYSQVPGNDVMGTLGLTNAITGERMHIDPKADPRKSVYIPERKAIVMFESAEKAIGREIINPDEVIERTDSVTGEALPDSFMTLTVAGVFRDYNRRANGGYAADNVFYDGEFSTSHSILIRLKKDASHSDFERNFEENIAHRFEENKAKDGSAESFGTMELELHSVDELMDDSRRGDGTTLGESLLTIFITFLLLCVFLAVTGSFWVRAHNRREDIGVMKSMGASSSSIVRMFLFESFSLVSLAFLVALPLLYFMAYALGIFKVPDNSVYGDLAYLSFERTHGFELFTLSIIVAYLLLTIVAAIATLIPTWRASKALPAAALREE